MANKPTLADGLLIGVARWLDFHKVAEAGRWPRLTALRRRLERDPGVRFAMAIENGQTPVGSGACQAHVALADVIRDFGRN